MTAVDVIVNVLGSVWSVLIYTWWIFILIGLYVMKKRWSRFPIEAVIVEKKGENLIKTNDRLGKRQDKLSEMTFSELQKAKDTIPILNYDSILHCAFKPTNIFERMINWLRPTIGTVFLYRYGTKQYKPIDISLNKDGKMKLKEIKDKKGEPLFQYEYEQFDPRWVLKVLDFEVVDWDNMNFMVQEQRATVLRRQKKREFWTKTLIPLVIIGACVVIGIFILKFSADAGANLKGSVAQPSGEPSGSKIMGGISDAFTPGA